MKRTAHYLRLIKIMKDNKGATLVIVGLVIVVLIGMAALAIDIGHLFVVDNELKNAADAGALTGAQVLYNALGTEVNQDANQVAYDVATQNRSDKTAVEVNWSPGGNTGTDVERGHWSFTTRTFTPNDSLAPVDLWDVSTEELDLNTDFINASRVRTRRESTPVASFFARILGHQSFARSAEAIAYRGFAGTLEPGVADQPIAICKQAILDADGRYTCGVGRMINSGSNPGHQTAGWSNFTQDPCETASANSVKPFVCGSGNPTPIFLGEGMGTTGGEVQVAFDNLIKCWKNAMFDSNGDGIPDTSLDSDGDGWPDKKWSLTLPVIECPGNNTGNCSVVVGAVEVDVVWITRTDKNQFNEVPRKMEEWSCPSTFTGQQCWASFVEHFELRDVLNNTPAFYEDKTLYFKPSCEPHVPAGRTGGENFGILARIPVLVK